jgi:hypothetical protein
MYVPRHQRVKVAVIRENLKDSQFQEVSTILQLFCTLISLSGIHYWILILLCGYCDIICYYTVRSSEQLCTGTVGQKGVQT